MFDYMFQGLIYMWGSFSSPLWLAIFLVGVVFVLAGCFVQFLNWFSFMLILLWISGFLVVLIYVSCSCQELSSFFVGFFVCLFFGGFVFSPLFLVEYPMFFSPTLSIMFGMYLYIFLFLFFGCFFISDILKYFGTGSFRMLNCSKMSVEVWKI